MGSKQSYPRVSKDSHYDDSSTSITAPRWRYQVKHLKKRLRAKVPFSTGSLSQSASKTAEIPSAPEATNSCSVSTCPESDVGVSRNGRESAPPKSGKTAPSTTATGTQTPIWAVDLRSVGANSCFSCNSRADTCPCGQKTNNSRQQAGLSASAKRFGNFRASSETRCERVRGDQALSIVPHGKMTTRTATTKNNSDEESAQLDTCNRISYIGKPSSRINSQLGKTIVSQPTLPRIPSSTPTRALEGDVEDLDNEDDKSPWKTFDARHPSYITNNPGKLPWRLEAGQWTQWGVGHREGLLPVSPTASISHAARYRGSVCAGSHVTLENPAAGLSTPALVSLVLSKTSQSENTIQFTTPCSRRAGRAVAAAAAGHQRRADCGDIQCQNGISNNFINWGWLERGCRTAGSGYTGACTTRLRATSGTSFSAHDSAPIYSGIVDRSSIVQSHCRKIDRGGEWTTFLPRGSVAFAGYPELPQNWNNIEDVLASRSYMLANRRSSCTDADRIGSFRVARSDASKMQDNHPDSPEPRQDWSIIEDVVARRSYILSRRRSSCADADRRGSISVNGPDAPKKQDNRRMSVGGYPDE